MEIWREQGWGAYLDFLQSRLGGTRFIQNVGDWLKELGLGPQIRATPARLGNLGFVSSVDIFEVTNGVPINLHDMGFGASQILPIIVQCLAATAGSLVIIEQPELHLHPQVQARLADLFIAISHITENKKGIKHEYSNVPFLIEGSEKLEIRLSTIRFLVETHSEHLMLRFRRRIAETIRNILQPDHEGYPHNRRFNLHGQDFNLLFVERKKGASTLESIDIDHRGQPVKSSKRFRAFFDDDFEEVANLTRARNAIIGIEDGSEENSENSS
jgi:predicted ATPase